MYGLEVNARNILGVVDEAVDVSLMFDAGISKFVLLTVFSQQWVGKFTSEANIAYGVSNITPIEIMQQTEGVSKEKNNRELETISEY